MTRRTPRILLLALALVGSASPAQEPRPRVAVLDFEANGASRELATAATALFSNELQSFGAFDVVTSDAIQSVVAIERQKQLLGCPDESSCLAELAGALGVDWIVIGRVSRVGETLTVDVSLIEARTAARKSSAVESAATEGALLKKVAPVAGKVMAPLLRASAATVLVTASEVGATVRLDGSIVGVTPLEGRLETTPGSHLLEVEKEGFVAFRRQLKLSPGDVTDQTVTLVPSPDFIASYEARESRLRMGAWIATAVAVLGAGGAAYLQYDASRLYGPAERDGTFLFHRARVTDDVTEPTDRDHWTKANSLRQRIQRNETLSWVSGGVGAAAAVGAVTLWMLGDDPDRYSRFRTLKVTPSVSSDGAGLQLKGAF